MDINHAQSAFGALGQETRIRVLRLLIRAGATGLLAGQISDALDVRQNTMSANLSVMLQAGLIKKQRQGRSIRYFADLEGLQGLLAFLMEDCCGGQQELCRPIIEELTCSPAETPHRRTPTKLNQKYSTNQKPHSQRTRALND